MRSGAWQARRRQLRHRMLSLALLFTVCLIVARSAQLQVLQGSDWRAASVRQHEKNRPVPAPRGAIYDRNGRELAISRITYSLAVSPRELENPRAAAEVLRDALPLASAKARRIAEGKTSWVVIGGRHSVVLKNQLESRLGKRGLHFEPTVERFYPRGDLAVELLGRIDVSGRGASGLELTFDSVLTGQPGLSVKRQDAKGIGGEPRQSRLSRQVVSQGFGRAPNLGGELKSDGADAQLERLGQPRRGRSRRRDERDTYGYEETGN